MPEFLKGRQSSVFVIIIIAIILIGAFFLFGNKQQGEITEKAAQQTEEQKKEEEQKKDQEENKKEESKLPRDYTVSKGDHLWKIATAVYKDGYKWVNIASANNIKNPDLIIPGQKLTLPKITAASTYTVVRGDTLWDISNLFYGSGFSWTKIRDANVGKIGKLKNGNPLIMPGQVLKIP